MAQSKSHGLTRFMKEDGKARLGDAATVPHIRRESRDPPVSKFFFQISFRSKIAAEQSPGRPTMPTLRKRRSTAAPHADVDDAIGGDSAANSNASDGNGGSQLLLQAGGATAKNKTANEDIDEAEAALAAAKETRRAKAKKRRLEAKQRLPRFEVLVEQGLMPLVVDLLSDSPKSLFALYCVSKRSHPFLTREIVVKS